MTLHSGSGSDTQAPPHPYYPLGVEIPNYVANEWSALALVSTFAVTCVAVLSAARILALKINPGIERAELGKVLWFVLCGSIHLLLEGHYTLNFESLPNSKHILSQLWKEYAHSDSRYLTNDSFVWAMENITAWIWGPLSFVLAYFITTDNVYRHPLQIVVSTGQLYGDVLYYGTVFFENWVFGVEYSRPENYYFFGYFVFLNAFWIVIPSLMIADSVRACGRVFGEAKRNATQVKGDAKKRS